MPVLHEKGFTRFQLLFCFNSIIEEVSMLAEMFPEACSLEIQNCLMVANGDVESAVQLMLLKKENIDDDGKESYHQVRDSSPKVHARSHNDCFSTELTNTWYMYM